MKARLSRSVGRLLAMTTLFCFFSSTALEAQERYRASRGRVASACRHRGCSRRQGCSRRRVCRRPARTAPKGRVQARVVRVVRPAPPQIRPPTQAELEAQHRRRMQRDQQSMAMFQQIFQMLTQTISRMAMVGATQGCPSCVRPPNGNAGYARNPRAPMAGQRPNYSNFNSPNQPPSNPNASPAAPSTSPGTQPASTNPSQTAASTGPYGLPGSDQNQTSQSATAPSTPSAPASKTTTPEPGAATTPDAAPAPTSTSLAIALGQEPGQPGYLEVVVKSFESSLDTTRFKTRAGNHGRSQWRRTVRNLTRASHAEKAFASRPDRLVAQVLGDKQLPEDQARILVASAVAEYQWKALWKAYSEMETAHAKDYYANGKTKYPEAVQAPLELLKRARAEALRARDQQRAMVQTFDGRDLALDLRDTIGQLAPQ